MTSNVRTCLWFDKDGLEAAERVREALSTMKKIDVATLVAAFDGASG